MELKQGSAGGSVLFLTGMNTLSQLAGFGYRVILSRMAGAEVMGLYQLVMSAYGVMQSLCSVGVTSAGSNLSAQYLALGNGRALDQTRRMCLSLLAASVGLMAVVVLLWIFKVMQSQAARYLIIALMGISLGVNGISGYRQSRWAGFFLMVFGAALFLGNIYMLAQGL